MNPEPAILENDDGRRETLITCNEYEEDVELYSLVNSMLIFVSFSLCFFFVCVKAAHHRQEQFSRFITTWGMGLVFSGLFLAATWPTCPSVCEHCTRDSSLTYIYLTIFSGFLWLMRGKQIAARSRRSFGALDDDIAIASEEVPVEVRRLGDPRPSVDLDDGETGLLDDEDHDDAYDDDDEYDSEDNCELTTVGGCVVVVDSADPSDKAAESGL